MPQYICIDLKSFYASAECVARGLDPLNTNLVVADESRTDKTICLAVTPPLKKYGVPGRPRLFEVIQKVKEINSERKAKDQTLQLPITFCSIMSDAKHLTVRCVRCSATTPCGHMIGIHFFGFIDHGHIIVNPVNVNDGKIMQTNHENMQPLCQEVSRITGTNYQVEFKKNGSK